MTSSNKSLASITELRIINNEVSIYKGDLTLDVVVEQNLRIRKAFPQLTSDWFDMLQERLKANNFTNKRLIDAVDHVIDTWTNTFTQPHIGHFISFDKKIKTLNDMEMQQLMNKEGQSIYRYYELVKIGEKIVYAHKNDVKEYNLEIYNPPKLVIPNVTGYYKDGKLVGKEKNPEAWKGFAQKILKKEKH